MAKSKVIAVDAGVRQGGGVEVVFYRFDPSPEQQAMGYTDWMQPHQHLTQASCQRIARILQGGNVIIWPDRIVMIKNTDDNL